MPSHPLSLQLVVNRGTERDRDTQRHTERKYLISFHFLVSFFCEGNLIVFYFEIFPFTLVKRERERLIYTSEDAPWLSQNWNFKTLERKRREREREKRCLRRRMVWKEIQGLKLYQQPLELFLISPRKVFKPSSSSVFSVLCSVSFAILWSCFLGDRDYVSGHNNVVIGSQGV